MLKKRDNNIDSAPMVKPTSQMFRKGDARRKAEEGLVYCLVHYPEFINRLQGQRDNHFFTEPEYLNIINILVDISGNMPSYEPAVLYNHIPDDDTGKVLTRLITRELPLINPEKFIDDCVAAIIEDETRIRREALLQQLEQADRDQDHELRKQLLQEYQNLLSK